MTDRSEPPVDADFQGRVTEWLELRGLPPEPELASVRATIATLPAPRARGGPVWLGIAAAAAVVVVVGGLALGGKLGFGPGSRTTGSTDPAAWAGDPRLASCSADLVAEPATVFEMTHAQWFPLYFPGWYRGAPELEVDAQALVVIGREQVVPASGGRPTGSIDPADRLGYQMCIAVGPPADATVHDYGWTHFDRIVPVLSAEDVARAAHLDPDVLADPAAWPFPERLTPCGGLTGNELYIFEASHLRDFRRYFPLATGVTAFDETDDPGIVIVYRERLSIHRLASWTPDPNTRDACVVIETDLARRAVVPDVDLRGFRLRVDGPVPTQSPISSPSIDPGALTASPAMTPEPAPGWTADLAGQLECSGDVSSIGGEVADGVARHVPAASADDAIAAFLAPPSPYGGLPTDGFTRVHSEAHWVSFGHHFGGRLKAILVASDLPAPGAVGWSIVALRACDPSEFDPTSPLTDTSTIWTDASGARVPTTVITSSPGTGHCGWESATFLWLGDVTYVRDPHGLSGFWAKPRFDPDSRLPAGARDTGYRSAAGELWTLAEGDAYLVSRGQVERWPRLDPSVGCT